MIRWRSVAMATSLLALGLSACATTGTTAPAKPATKPAEKAEAKPLPKGMDGQASTGFPSTYVPLPSRATAFVGATILTATGQQIENGVVFVSGGKISSVGGPETPIPADVAVIDAKGKWITPGIIDAHSHLGVYPSPGVQARSDGNEATDPNTAQVWAEHSVWPQDPGFNRARAGGITTMLILPGSANLFGGRSVTLKNVPALTMQGMKFPDAPYGLKMACGENPKRVYGGKGRSPSTAMGNVFGYRKAWIDAADYARKWDDYRSKQQKGEKGDAPKRDLQMETLAGVLKGEILVQNHCYRADEEAVMIDIAKEFGYKITMFHHAVESYKIAPLLAKEGICSATWASWTGFKMESLDGIDANAAILWKNGACVVIHSDDPIMTQRLNQEAAMTAGHRKLSNLTLIVDRNRLQQGAPTEETVSLEPLGDKWRAFGWDVLEIDGHDPAALITALETRGDKPLCVIASTIKGKGVSYMENQAGWHHGCPNPEQYAQALRELAQ